MTVGTLVNHWAHGRGIVIDTERLKHNAGITVKVHWAQPLAPTPGFPPTQDVWTDPEDLEIVSEVK